MDILSEIFTHKKQELALLKQTRPLTEVRRQAEAAGPSADLIGALRRSPMHPALIAEVKFHSPSRGSLAKRPDPLRLASIYSQSGADAISVLTDETYFHGRLNDLRQIHAALPRIPLLRKDFILDPYQVYETRAAGASSILLIAAYLPEFLLTELHDLALNLGLTPLVEVHNYAEMEAALAIPDLKLLGVNNRNLHTFKVDLRICLSMRPLVPQEVLFVAESGIREREDIDALAEAGVDAVLIGEALVTSTDPAVKIRELFARNTGEAA